MRSGKGFRVQKKQRGYLCFLNRVARANLATREYKTKKDSVKLSSSFWSGKRDSSPRYARANFRELFFTPPAPERGVLGSLVRISLPENTKRKKTALSCLLRSGAENESLTCVHPSFWDRKSCDFLGLLLSSAVTVLAVFRVRNIPHTVLLKFLYCSYLYKGNKIILTYKL